MQKLEEKLKEIEAIAADASLKKAAMEVHEAVFAGLPQLRDAISRVLRGDTQQARLSGLHTLRKNLRNAKSAVSSKTLKAFTVGTASLGRPTILQRFLARSRRLHHLQDYITEVPLTGNVFELQAYSDRMGEAADVAEGDPKPEITRKAVSNRTQATKIAATELYSQEVLSFLGETAQALMELDLLLDAEDRLSDVISATILGTAAPFNATAFAGAVPQANWVDVLMLMYGQEAEERLFESRRSESKPDLIILPVRYFHLFPSSLKTTQGEYLFSSMADFLTFFEQKYGIPTGEISVVTHAQTVAPATFYAVVARSAEYFVALLDEVVVSGGRVVDETRDLNLYRLTLDLFVAMQYTPRVTDPTQGYARFAHLVNDRNTINAS